MQESFVVAVFVVAVFFILPGIAAGLNFFGSNEEKELKIFISLILILGLLMVLMLVLVS